MHFFLDHAQEPPPCLERPLFSCNIAAGFPSPADDYIECGLDLNQFLVIHPSATFYVRVAGDSMMEAGILDRDYLIVDRAVEPRSGCIVVVVLDGELTVKRLHKQFNQVELRAENPKYPPILISGGRDLNVWGVVTGVFRKI